MPELTINISSDLNKRLRREASYRGSGLNFMLQMALIGWLAEAEAFRALQLRIHNERKSLCPSTNTTPPDNVLPFVPGTGNPSTGR